MAWRETSPMNEKTQFIADYLRDLLTVTELCEHYGISRKTGYKWIDRYLSEGPAGLEERTRRPRTCPHKTPARLERLIIDARQRHPTWGARKLRTFLSRKHPREPWPTRTTIHDILIREGFIRTPRRSRKLGHPGKPETRMNAPNQTWGADFKGHFKTEDGRYCYPLTVTDGFSRYLIGCQSLLTTAVEPSKAVFTRLFKEYGLPERIRTDNGVPFATNTLGRLSTLSAWWIRLGIYPELIEPGKPQQNGRHERMHRTLKAETTRPPAGDYRAQQKRFNRFQIEFNEERPHEALDMFTPADFYEFSAKEMPSKIPPLEYPDRFIKRFVSANGGIRWHSTHVPVSIACAGEYIGLEEIDCGVWNVYFGTLKLGRMIEKYNRIEDAYGRLKRHYR